MFDRASKTAQERGTPLDVRESQSHTTSRYAQMSSCPTDRQNHECLTKQHKSSDRNVALATLTFPPLSGVLFSEKRLSHSGQWRIIPPQAAGWTRRIRSKGINALMFCCKGIYSFKPCRQHHRHGPSIKIVARAPVCARL